MHCSTLRLYAEDDAPVPPPVVSFQVVRSRVPADPLRPAIARARQALLGRQQPDGSFAESRVVDPRSLAMLVLAKAFVEPLQPGQFRQEVRGLLAAQRADGGWSASGSGPLDLGTNVLAYFALKLSGQSPASEPMVCARRAILSRGGLTQIDNEAKLWLAVLGQYPFEAIASPRLERLLLPDAIRSWISKASGFSSPARLCHGILAALRPRRYVPGNCGIRELFVAEPPGSARPRGMLARWHRRPNLLPLRRRAVAAARQALLGMLETWTDAGDGNQPSLQDMAWIIVTLDCLGFTPDTAPRRRADESLDRLIDREAEMPRHQVTSYSAHADVIVALQASGLTAEHHGLRRALDRFRGHQPPSVADAAQQLIVAAHLRHSRTSDEMLPPSLQACADDTDETPAGFIVKELDEAPLDEAPLREKILKAQRVDGSWSQPREHRNIAMTAIALHALAVGEVESTNPALLRAGQWLRGQQLADGSWPASEGEGAIAVTSRVLQALTSAGVDVADDPVTAGAEWLLAHQQPGGGWGDADPGNSKALPGEGVPTPRDTAAALAGLLAAGHEGSEAVARAVDYLIAQQDSDGQWANARTATECEATPDGAPLEDTAGPLWALSQYAAQVSQPRPCRATANRLTAPALRIAPWSCEAG